MAAIAHNVMTALKRLALPAELLTARPKRLRFLIFNTPGGWCSTRGDCVAAGDDGGALAEWLEVIRLLPIRV